MRFAQECFLLTAGCLDAGEDVQQKDYTQCSVLCFLLFFKLRIYFISTSTLLTLHLPENSKLYEADGLFFFSLVLKERREKEGQNLAI